MVSLESSFLTEGITHFSCHIQWTSGWLGAVLHGLSLLVCLRQPTSGSSASLAAALQQLIVVVLSGRPAAARTRTAKKPRAGHREANDLGAIEM